MMTGAPVGAAAPDEPPLPLPPDAADVADEPLTPEPVPLPVAALAPDDCDPDVPVTTDGPVPLPAAATPDPPVPAAPLAWPPAPLTDDELLEPEAATIALWDSRVPHAEAS